jgi:hypothetical protein
MRIDDSNCSIITLLLTLLCCNLQALNHLKSLHLDLPLLLELVCWGSPLCVSDAIIRNARTSLTHYRHLGLIIDQLHSPPKTANTKAPSKGAHKVLETWAFACVQDAIQIDMKQIGKLLRLEANEILEDYFCQLIFARSWKR